MPSDYRCVECDKLIDSDKLGDRYCDECNGNKLIEEAIVDDAEAGE